MRNTPDSTPEVMVVDVKRLEELLGENESVDSEDLGVNFRLAHVSLRRVVDVDMYALLLRYKDAIEAIQQLKDSAQVAEGLAHFEGLGVSAQGNVFSGYGLMQVNTDSHAVNSSIGLAISNDGIVQRVDGKAKITTQGEIDKIVDAMLEKLRNRKNDHKQTIRTIIGLGRLAEEQGIVQRLDHEASPQMVARGNDNDIAAVPKLSRKEVVTRLDQIRSALQAQLIRLSPQA